MNYEVELKFPIADPASVDRRLEDAGIQWTHSESHRDCYFMHPARDFRQSDEAFRLRTIQDRHWLTYKGPKLDAETKTRREIELPVGDGIEQGESMIEMLRLLGFRTQPLVLKQRRHGTLEFRSHQVNVARDEVDQLGSFVELELISSESELDACRTLILDLAKDLGLESPERRGYIQLLLAK